jgi:hypothetical protein
MIIKVVQMARMFGQRPSKIIDPEGMMGELFAFEFDAFCSNLALKMIVEGKLV